MIRIQPLNSTVKLILVCGILLAGSIPTLGLAQKKKENQLQPHKKLTYKKSDDVELTLHLFQPEKHQKSDKRPLPIVFFFGGGWVGRILLPSFIPIATILHLAEWSRSLQSIASRANMEHLPKSVLRMGSRQFDGFEHMQPSWESIQSGLPQVVVLPEDMWLLRPQQFRRLMRNRTIKP